MASREEEGEAGEFPGEENSNGCSPEGATPGAED